MPEGVELMLTAPGQRTPARYSPLRVCPDTVFALASGPSMARMIAAFGSEEQKPKYPPLDIGKPGENTSD